MGPSASGQVAACTQTPPSPCLSGLRTNSSSFFKMPRRSSSPGSLPFLPWALWCPVIDIEDIPPWPNTVFLSCGGALQEWRPGSFRPSYHDGAGSGMGSGVLVSYRWTMWDHGCWTQALQCQRHIQSATDMVCPGQDARLPAKKWRSPGAPIPTPDTTGCSWPASGIIWPPVRDRTDAFTRFGLHQSEPCDPRALLYVLLTLVPGVVQWKVAGGTTSGGTHPSFSGRPEGHRTGAGGENR